MRKHVVIAVPAYTGVVHLATMRSIIADVTALMGRGDLVSVDDECGSADLRDTRSAMAARFLAGDATHLLSVDNDVCWTPGSIPKLLDYGVDVVAGVYPKREDPIAFPVRYLDAPVIPYDEKTGLIEVEAVQGGFVCYSRACLERMADAYKNLAFLNDRWPGMSLPGLWREEVLPNGHKLGEDFSFFRKWRAIGGKVWADPTIAMGHFGLKAFCGTYGDWLKDRAHG